MKKWYGQRSLLNIPRNNAKELVICLTYEGLYKRLGVQNKFSGRSTSDYLDNLFHKLKETKTERRNTLNRLAKNLSWPQRKEYKKAPSVHWLAKKNGQLDEFNFIYDGTSRYVHLSTQELMRRAWGNPESMLIDSSQFEDYWSEFSMFWGIRIFLSTSLEILSFLDTQDQYPKFKEIHNFIKKGNDEFQKLEVYPIITEKELTWYE